MRQMFVAACHALPLLALFPCSASAGPREDYELQERCGKRAEESFRREWGSGGVTNTPDGQAIASYRNHYNGSLNKCFVLLTYQSIPFKDKKARPSKQITLYDINESKDYGFFFKFNDNGSPTDCRVAGKSCRSEAEWETLIAPYMGD